MINSNEFTLLQNIPNPSNGLTTIKFNTPNSNIVNLTITDIYGKVVYTENISTIIGLNEINLNLDLTQECIIIPYKTINEFCLKE